MIVNGGQTALYGSSCGSSVSSHVHVASLSVSGEGVGPMRIFDLLLHEFFSPPTIIHFFSNWQLLRVWCSGVIPDIDKIWCAKRNFFHFLRSTGQCHHPKCWLEQRSFV